MALSCKWKAPDRSIIAISARSRPARASSRSANCSKRRSTSSSAGARPPFGTTKIASRLFNGSGSEPARYLAVTTAPTMINLLHNLDFIFHNDFAFADRFDARQSYFNGEGILYAGDYKGFKFAGNVWETNFVPDARGFKLLEYNERGAGGSKIKFELSENTTA